MKRPVWVPEVAYLRALDRAAIQADLQAGITVAVFAVPQVMAYAMLAGVAPINGLYTIVIACLVGAIWGQSPFVNTGPSNSAALLCATALITVTGSWDPMVVVFHFAILVGVFRLMLGFARASKLLQFLSARVMLGFTAGVGTLIAFGQLHHLLGISIGKHRWFLLKLVDISALVPDANPSALVIGGTMVVLMIMLHRHSRRIPVALLGIVACSLVAEALHGWSAVPRVRDIAEVSNGLPVWAVPGWNGGLAWQLTPFAMAVAVIGLIEVATVARIFAEKQGVEVDDDREFFGQGLAQLVSAFFQGIPTSASFSRSALLEFAGVKTRLANLFFSLFLALALVLVARWFNVIPVAALAGLLLVMGIRLIKWREVRDTMRGSRSAGWVIAVTFFTTVFVHIEYGVFVGILLDRTLVWWAALHES